RTPGADVVSEGCVDVFEAVEIEEQDRDRAAPAILAATFERLVKLVEVEPAVRESRERVVQRAVAQRPREEAHQQAGRDRRPEDEQPAGRLLMPDVPLDDQ